jgi:LacI family transcriptional regulator
MGAYDAIKERGLRIPDDVGVVGFDNQEIIAAYLRPPLTTVALPFEEMGAAAVRLLAANLTGSPSERLVLAGPLVERGSVS